MVERAGQMKRMFKRATFLLRLLKAFDASTIKTGQFFDIGFLVSKRVIGHDLIQLEVVRMTMYEENSMDFCITTLG